MSNVFIAPLSLILDLRYRIKIISALMIREVHTRFGRDNIGALWVVGEPFLFTLIVVFLWYSVRSPNDNSVPVAAFVLTGYAPLTMWRHSVSRSTNCFQANAGLLYHKQIGLMDILVARIMLEVYGTIMAFIVICSGFYLVGIYDPPVNYGLFYLGWIYLILFSIGTALIVSCLSEQFDWIEKLTSPLLYIMAPLSGAFYLVDWLPYPAQKVALLLPSVHGFELIRAGQFGPALHMHYDIPYVTYTCLFLILIGLILSVNVRKYIEME